VAAIHSYLFSEVGVIVWDVLSKGISLISFINFLFAVKAHQSNPIKKVKNMMNEITGQMAI
jgi:hypothetical protein